MRVSTSAFPELKLAYIFFNLFIKKKVKKERLSSYQSCSYAFYYYWHAALPSKQVCINRWLGDSLCASSWGIIFYGYCGCWLSFIFLHIITNINVFTNCCSKCQSTSYTGCNVHNGIFWSTCSKRLCNSNSNFSSPAYNFLIIKHKGNW